MADDSSSAFQPTGAGQQAAQLPIQAGVVQAPRAVQHGLVEQLGSFVTDDVLEVDVCCDSSCLDSSSICVPCSAHEYMERDGCGIYEQSRSVGIASR
jgi:hypothetical protein